MLAQLDDLYRMLLVDGPIELEFAPEQPADQLVGLTTKRRIVGLTVTPAGWFGMALAFLWTCYAPAGLVAFVRRAHTSGEELPMHLDWVPEYVWPQRRPETSEEAVAQAQLPDEIPATGEGVSGVGGAE